MVERLLDRETTRYFNRCTVDEARVIRAAKLVCSMSRKACLPDNATCEGLFGRLKTEMFYHQNWQATKTERFIDAVDFYIHWYNGTRTKVSLGALSRIEYRESLGRAA